MEEIRFAHHGLGEIAVEIEGHRDGHPRPHHAAHGLDEIALAVVEPLGHHGAVQVEEHAVHRARRLEITEHPLLHVAVDVLGDEAGGRGGGGHGGNEGGPPSGGLVDHAAEAGAGTAEGLDDLAAVVQAARLELLAVGGDIAEGVRLVRHHGQEQSHPPLLDGRSPPRESTRRPGAPTSSLYNFM